MIKPAVLELSHAIADPQHAPGSLDMGMWFAYSTQQRISMPTG